MRKPVFGVFQQGPTQTRLYSHRRWLETCKFGFRKKRDCTIYVAKTKALISCAVTAQLVCAFVFAYAKSGFLMTWLIYKSWFFQEQRKHLKEEYVPDCTVSNTKTRFQGIHCRKTSKY